MSEEIQSQQSKQKVGEAVNTIPLAAAQKWAKRWAKKEGHYNKHHELQAFLIPKVDLIEVLAEGVDAVRAYIGVDDNGVEKLMIVGAKYDPITIIYVDMISVGVENAITQQNDIYDFTRPCPPSCDPNSPMLT
jgi:cystathionine beta-lyase family protein involved in aluminum resistance